MNPVENKSGAHLQAAAVLAPEQAPAVGQAAEIWHEPSRLRDWWRSPSGAVWRDAAGIWLVTRVVFLLLTYLTPALLIHSGARSGGLLAPLQRWVTQDGYHFAEIARNGYTPVWRTAFWPLFPALEHVLGAPLGGQYGLAGILISNVAFFGALVALRSVAERDIGAEASRRAALYLAIFPTAFYFFAPYSEALFLCLGISSFAAMRSRRWLLAGVLGCLATLTRSAGVLLLVPFVVEFFLAWRSRQTRLPAILCGALIPLGAGIYALYLGISLNNPLAFQHSEGWWNRSLQPPWMLVILTLRGISSSSSGHAITWTHTLLNFAVLVVFAVLAVLTLRALPLSFGLYTLAMVLYVFLFPVTTAAVASQSDARYVLMMFPVFLTLGTWRKPAWLHEALLICMLPLLAILCAEFLLGLASG